MCTEDGFSEVPRPLQRNHAELAREQKSEDEDEAAWVRHVSAQCLRKSSGCSASCSLRAALPKKTFGTLVKLMTRRTISIIGGSSDPFGGSTVSGTRTEASHTDTTYILSQNRIRN